jgi:hypothetical protein
VTVLPLRDPLLAAKQIATLDTPAEHHRRVGRAACIPPSRRLRSRGAHATVAADQHRVGITAACRLDRGGPSGPAAAKRRGELVADVEQATWSSSERSPKATATRP